MDPLSPHVTNCRKSCGFGVERITQIFKVFKLLRLFIIVILICDQNHRTERKNSLKKRESGLVQNESFVVAVLWGYNGSVIEMLLLFF